MQIKTIAYAKIGRIIQSIFTKNSIGPILSGPLRSSRWIVKSGNLEYFLGSYENKKIKRFKEEVANGMTIYDIGAHVGYYTIIASKKDPNGKIFSFEPSPRNYTYLKWHLQLNSIDNVKIINAAVSNLPGKSFFKREGYSSYEGKLVEEGGDEVVSTVSLDDLVSNGKLPAPNLMKIDAEGAEASILEGSRQTIERYKPIIFLATHGTKVHALCNAMLEEWEYKIEPLNSDKVQYATEVLAKHK